MEMRNVLRNNIASLWANAPVVMLSCSRPSSLLSRTAKWMNYFFFMYSFLCLFNSADMFGIGYVSVALWNHSATRVN